MKVRIAALGFLLFWTVFGESCSSSPERLSAANRTLSLAGAPAFLNPLISPSGRPSTARFLVLLLSSSSGCPCRWTRAYQSLREAKNQERLDVRLEVLVEGDDFARRKMELTDVGVNERDLVSDEKALMIKALNLASSDLPLWVVLDTASGYKLVMSSKVSPVYGEQALAGAMLATLHSFPGGQLP